MPSTNEQREQAKGMAMVGMTLILIAIIFFVASCTVLVVLL
jgi:hypothetical protein